MTELPRAHGAPVLAARIRSAPEDFFVEELPGFEASGAGVRDLLARAVTVDPDHPGPCAAMPFGGVMAVVYRHGDAGTLRIHVDRGLASYLWEWFECQPLLAQG